MDGSMQKLSKRVWYHLKSVTLEARKHTEVMRPKSEHPVNAIPLNGTAADKVPKRLGFRDPHGAETFRV